LRHKGLSLKNYTEEFYKMNIREGHRENEEKVSRYINGLRYEIQDDISLMKIRTLRDGYQVTLREEKNLERKDIHRNK